MALKPDAVQRGLIGEIISRFEKKGFKLVGMKLLQATKEQAEGHYADLKSKPFFGGLVDFFSSGPIVAMVWEGKGVVLTARKMMGGMCFFFFHFGIGFSHWLIFRDRPSQVAARLDPW